MRDKGSRREVSGDGKKRGNIQKWDERRKEKMRRDFLCYLLAFQFTGHIFMGQCLREHRGIKVDFLITKQENSN